MSSWKKAGKVGQKTHRERHQPEARRHLGLLEKKKDYVARAKDFQEKQATIKLLRKRALNKNPDEFHFHMINSKLENGVHKEKKQAEHTPEQIKLMETQDIKYIAYRKHLESRKINKLQSELHMIDTANETKNQHIFFVDNNEEMKNFDLAKKLDTHPALLSRRINRPRMSQLSKMKLPELDEKAMAKLQQKNHMSYTELAKRLDRERELTIVQQKLEMRTALKDQKITKPKCIKPGTKVSAPIYKWKYERKR
ncbi:probable U3 small nucleolar RNA-associated protein 11 [Odontomachus brunneus]|uniref:probable U3 small nucleolar RNA-associated protein 11 n=1 Tax=Odontomachus brunneus TaxID=486640 RepID=UPI0013F1F8B6|nr:probable U3 small nucleolar RNA-associated protein 11 [Odontomachus brunneus]XP_032670180.1 probable U3 small nucleolar RNA-associated protein 11 [Odontomachus brunneus]XP_032670181.1 probable U3 small nucleolar RNA-associated protein 11 [Odontomachus brunneus]XP_032670182.1 probable U3 small nucleolar RNA-associated protein 11 [Odontomachus brunneus]